MRAYPLFCVLLLAMLGCSKPQSGKNNPGSASRDFTVQESSLLKLAETLKSGRMYTKDGARLKALDDPTFVALASVSPLGINDPEDFAEGLFQQFTGAKNAKIDSSKQVTISGLRGIEMIASGTHDQTGAPLLIYQTILIEGSNYYAHRGEARAAERATYLPEFQRMARSFKKS